LSNDPPVSFQFVQIPFVFSEQWINWTHPHYIFNSIQFISSTDHYTWYGTSQIISIYNT
jgi:hypothetical protein